jgi:hypothetical protein
VNSKRKTANGINKTIQEPGQGAGEIYPFGDCPEHRGKRSPGRRTEERQNPTDIAKHLRTLDTV